MGSFGAAHGCGGGGGPEGKKSPSLTYFYKDETWHSYALPREDPKNI